VVLADTRSQRWCGFFAVKNRTPDIQEDKQMPACAEQTHYTTPDLVAITGINAARLNQLFGTGVIVPSRADKRPSSSGDLRLNSLATVHQVAIMAEFEKVNVPPRMGASTARLFTDKASPGRPAGKLFPLGRTVAVIRPTGPELINVLPDADFWTLSNLESSFTAVDINSVVKRVDELLLTIDKD
jgi:hypothetical protein